MTEKPKWAEGPEFVNWQPDELVDTIGEVVMMVIETGIQAFAVDASGVLYPVNKGYIDGRYGMECGGPDVAARVGNCLVEIQGGLVRSGMRGLRGKRIDEERASASASASALEDIGPVARAAMRMDGIDFGDSTPISQGEGKGLASLGQENAGGTLGNSVAPLHKEPSPPCPLSHPEIGEGEK